MPNYNDLNIGMDFISNPVMPGSNNNIPQPVTTPQQLPSYQINTALAEPEPVLTAPKKSIFTVIPDDVKPSKGAILPAPDVVPVPKTRKKKEPEPTAIVPAPDTQKELSTMYNYAQTTALLGGTLTQADELVDDLKNEFDNVKNSRTLKNKYMILTNLAQSMSQLYTTKASILREINASITKATELDYKKEKDRLAAEGAANDDKHIMDLYNSFVNNPMANTSGNIATLGPSPIVNTVSSSNGLGIIRSPLAQSQPAPNGVTDIGYLNYLNRMTPQQNSMIMEKDPNVQICVVYDAQTGAKFFQCMNVATGQAIPNVDLPNERFLADTTIDLMNKVAKNANLRTTYPLIVLNDSADIAKNY